MDFLKMADSLRSGPRLLLLFANALYLPKVLYLVFINLANFHSVSKNLDIKLPIPHLFLPQPLPAVVPHPSTL